MIRRYQRRDASRAASKRRVAAASRAATTTKTSVSRTRIPSNVQATIGRYKGGSTVRAYDGSYHISSAKKSRRKSRETRRQSLGRKKTGRYSQLM